jgi:hypothetical protein
MIGNGAEEMEFAWSNKVKPLRKLSVIRVIGEIQSRNLANT